MCVFVHECMCVCVCVCVSTYYNALHCCYMHEFPLGGRGVLPMQKLRSSLLKTQSSERFFLLQEPTK